MVLVRGCGGGRWCGRVGGAGAEVRRCRRCTLHSPHMLPYRRPRGNHPHCHHSHHHHHPHHYHHHPMAGSEAGDTCGTAHGTRHAGPRRPTPPHPTPALPCPGHPSHTPTPHAQLAPQPHSPTPQAHRARQARTPTPHAHPLPRSPPRPAPHTRTWPKVPCPSISATTYLRSTAPGWPLTNTSFTCRIRSLCSLSYLCAG